MTTNNGTDLSVSRRTVVVDYTSLDFDALKTDLESYVQATFSDRWTDFNESQFAEVFLKTQAYIGDVCSYQINASVREAFASTCVRRGNFLALARPFSYESPGQASATASLRLTLDAGATYPFNVSSNDQYSNGDSEDEVFFQPVTTTAVAAYPGSGYVDIDCIEGEKYVGLLLGVSDGSTDQRYQFAQDSVVESSVSVVVGATTWTKVTNFSGSLSTDQHYRVLTQDDGSTFVLFGDGVYGAIPPNTNNITATFRVGGGRRGNLNSDTITTIVSADPAVLSVTNPLPSTGGDNLPGLRQEKASFAGSFPTQDRVVTSPDVAAKALTVSGVAKARSRPGLPLGGRRIRVCIAPNGGGTPSSLLKSQVGAALFSKKMSTYRIQVVGPTYKDVTLSLLLHVNSSFRAQEVESTVRSALINSQGTGYLDFNQLDFAGLDSDGDPLFGQTRLQTFFNSLRVSGLERCEILQCSVEPSAVAKETGNTGTGTVGSFTQTIKRRRRQYYVLMTSSSTFNVYERLVGRVSTLTNTVLTDEDVDFDDEGVLSFAGYKLNPDRNGSNILTVASATNQGITASSGQTSLFLLTTPGEEYYLYSNSPTAGTVGSTVSVGGGDVTFVVTAGATPFVAGDSFTIDVFPLVSDLVLRTEEYPELLAANLVTRTSGGAKV